MIMHSCTHYSFIHGHTTNCSVCMHAWDSVHACTYYVYVCGMIAAIGIPFPLIAGTVHAVMYVSLVTKLLVDLDRKAVTSWCVCVERDIINTMTTYTVSDSTIYIWLVHSRLLFTSYNNHVHVIGNYKLYILKCTGKIIVCIVPPSLCLGQYRHSWMNIWIFPCIAVPNHARSILDITLISNDIRPSPI